MRILEKYKAKQHTTTRVNVHVVIHKLNFIKYERFNYAELRIDRHRLTASSIFHANLNVTKTISQCENYVTASYLSAREIKFRRTQSDCPIVNHKIRHNHY